MAADRSFGKYCRRFRVTTEEIHLESPYESKMPDTVSSSWVCSDVAAVVAVAVRMAGRGDIN